MSAPKIWCQLLSVEHVLSFGREISGDHGLGLTKYHKVQVSYSKLGMSCFFFSSYEKIQFDLGVFLNHLPIFQEPAIIDISKPVGDLKIHTEQWVWTTGARVARIMVLGGQPGSWTPDGHGPRGAGLPEEGLTFRQDLCSCMGLG